ncbi:unnamed protein product [marine sediment metagenome]|uniref:Uncharacterized protein n=1 Tax=marine sediment metagenome TaxID=412755 RepID=X0TS72_9ZZZZ
MATGEGTGTPAVSPSVTGNYIDGTDIDNWPDGTSNATKQEIVDRAEQLIENITHDYFYAENFAIYRDGNGNDKLFLGSIPNILSVSEIKLSGVVLGSSWYTFDKNSVYLDPEAVTGDELPELMLRMNHKRGLFPKGMGNVKITGTYGWSACPVAIKRAVIILCRYENDETLYTKYDDLVSDKLGDMTQSRGVDKKFLTGVQEADRLLFNYIRKKPIMGIA